MALFRSDPATLALVVATMLALGCETRSSAPPQPEPQPETKPIETSWLASAQQHVAAREYWASEGPTGLQAPNRRQNLRTFFDPTGIRVEGRTDAVGLLELRLVEMGRGNAREAVGPGRVSGDNARVEIEREGIVEWYENGPAGIEHGFVLAGSPPGEGPLVLTLALDGARAVERGDALLLTTATGRRLDYGKLVAWDAAGKPVSGTLSAPAARSIEIELADRGATYPISIDPLLSASADTQLESDQASADFGFSVASAGDVNGDGYSDVIVGAGLYDSGLNAEGAAFVFLGGPAGVASAGPLSAHAQLDGDQQSANFGHSVASAGDVNGDGYSDVIVGASSYEAGETSEGAAFVFIGGITGIPDATPATAHAQLEGDQASASFGTSVASAGDVNGDGYSDLIVGAWNYDAGTPAEGAAFLFLGGPAGVASAGPSSAHAQLEGNQIESRFGLSVASAGDVNGDGYSDVIVGARSYDAGQNAEGAAFIFLGGAAGVASAGPSGAHAQLEGDQTFSSFGESVASAGDTNGDGYSDVIVGAETYQAGETAEGAAFIFLGSSVGIPDGNPVTAHTQLESDQVSAFLGVSVASAGDVNGDGYADVIVGAKFYDAGENSEGAAFIFLGSVGGISDGSPATAHAQLESNQASAHLGISVASAGDVNGDGYSDLIVGATDFSSGEADEGAAFVYHGGPSVSNGDPLSANTRLESDQVDARLGASVATGDFNGDGYADVAVGAPEFDAGQADEGAAFIFLGGAGGIPDNAPVTATAQFESDQTDSNFGHSLASAGDVDGDGDEELLIGAPMYDANQNNEGAVFLFRGSKTGIPDGKPFTAGASFESDQINARFGWSVASAGDVNGDGFSDIVIGADGYDDPEASEGAAFVFHGSAFGVVGDDPLTAAATIQGDQGSAQLGNSVASAGDVNGDGYADIIIGAQFYDSGQGNEGAAFIYHGSAGGIVSGNPASADSQLEADQDDAKLGTSVSSAGDIDGDGFADVVVGASGYSNPEFLEGGAFVFLGSPGGVADGNPASAHARFEGNQAFAQLGHRVGTAGDINGDGYADVLASAHRFDVFLGGADEGAACLFLGSAAGIPDGDPFSADAVYFGLADDALMGSSLASGDVDGNGFSDVVVGAEGFDGSQAGEGGVFVFLANGTDGRTTLPRQHATGASQSDGIQPWGGIEDTSFDVSLVATHPEGRGKVKLEVEWCPQSLAFEHPICGNQVGAAWSDVTATSGGVVLRETIAGLPTGELVRWRARVLHAPFSIDEPGITAPASPRHGPWRRLDAQAHEADIRLLPEPGVWRAVLAGASFLFLLRYRRSPRHSGATPRHRSAEIGSKAGAWLPKASRALPRGVLSGFVERCVRTRSTSPRIERGAGGGLAVRPTPGSLPEG